jgi:hypothetical protein
MGFKGGKSILKGKRPKWSGKRVNIGGFLYKEGILEWGSCHWKKDKKK